MKLSPEKRRENERIAQGFGKFAGLIVIALLVVFFVGFFTNSSFMLTVFKVLLVILCISWFLFKLKTDPDFPNINNKNKKES